MLSIRKSFSAKLSLSLLLLAAPIFVISLGVLFSQSRYIIRQEAVGRANSVLSTMMQRICRSLTTIETATRANDWQVVQTLHPDSLLALTHRLVALNPHIDGCSISTEPDVFPEYGRYFSVYSIRETKDRSQEFSNDSITSVIEEKYEYFDKIWYKTPRDLDEPCWVVYYDEADSLELTIDGLLASFGMPIHDADNRFIGVISTDLSLLRLSKLISAEKPYRHSYFIMLDEKGDYYIHPDSTRLFTHSIFDVDDPNREADIIALGHEMTSGATGNMSVVIDGKPCIVCYQPIPGTGWSLAIVCPDSDVLENYHRLSYIIVPLLLIGVLIIMILCHRAVAHAIRPLNQLLEKTQSIASGDMEVHIPRSQRDDVVGRLQNSFARMLQSLNFHMGSVRYTTQQAKQRNEELARATALVQEADRQKTAFIQNVSHQIRTPLNILMGFAQILRDATPNSQVALSGDEVKIIVSTMDYNAKLLNRMVTMLFDSSETGLSEELQEITKHSQVPCNDVAREAISYIKLHYPDLNVLLRSEVADDFCINTNRLYLMRSLREILYNSAKYSDRQHVSIHITRQPATDSRQATVCFIIEDTGNGISEEYQDLMFKFFTKVDDLSEGLGLGLPLAKRHAQTLGGDLTLDHDYHNGCRFILELPIT